VLILRLILLWGLVSVHILGGAVLFRRLFPRESAWFGFIVPGLAVAIVLNFIEHRIGFSTLRWAFPVTFLGSLWLIMSPRTRWRGLRLPAAVFLAAFALTLVVHGLKPDVDPVRDGRTDVHLLEDYSMGGTLPPVSCWEPPLRQRYYYSFEHYAASVMDRLLDFEVGIGFNMAGALTSALIFFLIAAIAWRLGGHKTWIVWTCVILTASAMTGSTAFLWLMAPGNKEPDDTTNLLNRASRDNPHFPFYQFMPRLDGNYDQRELLVPGYWGWIGSFHSVVAGQFLTLLAVYSLVEMVRRRRTNWPWIGSLGACLLMIVCSTWGLPFVGLLFIGGIAWGFWKGIYPRSPRFVAVGWGLVTLGLSPTLMYYLAGDAPGIGSIQPYQRTELFEFVLQWWPVYLPWLALLFFWRRLSPATVMIMVVVPLALLAMEQCNVADRFDMTGKIWGYLYGAAWAVLIPSLAAISAYWMRGLLGFIAIAAGISLCFWVDFTHRTLQVEDRWHIEGLGDFRTDSVRSRIFHAVSTMNHQVILTGKCEWEYNEAPLLAAFTLNYDYIADDFDCDNHFAAGSFWEGKRRAEAINAIYEGRDPNAVSYLRDRNIVALVVWPDDHIPANTLDKLKAELAPAFWYHDCRDTDAAPDAPNAGVFLKIPGVK
jgi:hypothetical protein